MADAPEVGMLYYLVSFLLATWLIHTITITIYRLQLHPLAKFPGSKLAAATLWYEFYYDVVLQGKWTFRIREMHEQYGPIIRINPHELHIKDPDFYTEIYAPGGGGKKRNKYQWWCNMAGAPGSIFSTADHELHRRRRAPLDGFFPKQAVRSLEPLIREKVAKLVRRFENAAAKEEVVRVDCAFMAVTMDVICSYCFGSDRAYLDHDDFGLEWKETINGAWQKGAMLRHFPEIASIIPYFPRGLAAKLDPDFGRFLAWQDSVKEAVAPIVQGNAGKAERTIFHALRDSDLPTEEKTLRRLCDEGEIFTGAGSETTARTLAIILYYLVVTPECLSQLKKELRTAFPYPEIVPSWMQVEQLPYLSAVIQEGLRIMHGITTRLPRVVTDSIRYQDQEIPAGTPISATPYFVLSDPEIFPEPEKFIPERWLDPNQRLDQYQVAFNKGSRSCIGINLAYAEMYLVCAAVFRRFRFELYDTSFDDIEMAHDFFVAAPKQPARGIRVMVYNDV